MKISFILPGGGRAGGIKSTVTAANGLLQRGHNVRLLVNKNCDIKANLRRLWLRMRYPHSNNWLDMFEGTAERFANIERCAFEDNEIVVASGWWAGIEMRRLNRPNVIKVHYIRSMLRDPNKMRAAWEEDVPKIAVASYLEDVIAEIVGQKVTAVIPNGIDTKEYYPTVSDDRRNGAGTIFGWGYHKDPDTVLGVLKKLRQICPETPQRVFGSCRRSKEMPRRIYSRLPSMEKIREIYSRSLVWFVGSFSEGFPVPVLEAMACGCAVVATDCGGPRDIIVDGENGFLVEVGNVKQIVDRVKQLLDDAELRKKFVQKSKGTVSKFSWDDSVDKLEEVLHSLAEAY